MEKKSTKIIVFMITIIPAIVLIFLGVRLKARTIVMPSTTAVISRIETEIKSDRSGIRATDSIYTRYVTFEIDGEVYEAVTDTYSSDDSEGEEIKIYYDPEDLSVVYVDDKCNFLFICIGAFTALVGLLLVFGKSPAHS